MMTPALLASIVTLPAGHGSALSGVMTAGAPGGKTVESKVIASPEIAARIAARSVPVPLSAGELTTSCESARIRREEALAIGARRRCGRTRRLCGTPYLLAAAAGTSETKAGTLPPSIQSPDRATETAMFDPAAVASETNPGRIVR